MATKPDLEAKFQYDDTGKTFLETWWEDLGYGGPMMDDIIITAEEGRKVKTPVLADLEALKDDNAI